MNDLDIYAAVDRFNKEFNIKDNAYMLEKQTGIKPKYLTMHPSVCDKFFGGSRPVQIFGLEVIVNKLCPRDSIYFSDERIEERELP